MRAILIGLLFINCSAFSDSRTCMDSAHTQLEMNQCAQIIQKNADDELEILYRDITERHQHDSVFIKKLAIAQRAWMTYRDMQMDMMYPHSDELGYYGSAFPMCLALKWAELTKERIHTLKPWLEEPEEGDLCAGSLLQSN
jgi:uncharacterized protein YecT (DUF1311 family)